MTNSRPNPILRSRAREPTPATGRGGLGNVYVGGRGGAGNLRSSSREPATNGPEDYSDTRGRDPIPARDPKVVCGLLLLVSHTISHNLKRR